MSGNDVSQDYNSLSEEGTDNSSSVYSLANESFPEPLEDALNDGRVSNASSEQVDLSAALRHEYLHGLADTGILCALVPKICYRIPLLQIPGIVVVPHETIPLVLNHERARTGITHALQAEPPLKGFVVCVNVEHAFTVDHTLQVERALSSTTASPNIADAMLLSPSELSPSAVPVSPRLCVCIAEVKSIAEEDGVMSSCILRGRYRGEMVARDWRKPFADVAVLPEDDAGPLPRPFRDGTAHWPAWAARPFDAAALAATAQARFAAAFPNVRPFVGSPERLSFWLAVHLPVARHAKQQLLQAHSTAARLRKVLELLEGLETQISCALCSNPLSSTNKIVTMTEEGPGGAFVNEHGYVHDMLCVAELQVDSVRYYGSAETANSWFPGFAWTIMNCALCTQHLGWRFSKVSDVGGPSEFWGLRRASVRHKRHSGAAVAEQLDPRRGMLLIQMG